MKKNAWLFVVTGLLVAAIATAYPLKEKSGKLFDWYIGGVKVMEIDDTGVLKIDEIQSLSGGSTKGAMPTGGLVPFAGSVVPNGFLLCDGSAVSRTTYADLFAAIGTTWGIGDGATTFNLPDLGGRYLKGAGSINDGQGGDSVVLGAFQDDETASNALSNSTSTVSGVTGTLDSQGDHGHQVTGIYTPGGTGSGNTAAALARIGGDPNNGGTSVQNPGTNTTGSHSHTFTQTGTGTAAAQTISGGSETRPKSYGVNYIIKI